MEKRELKIDYTLYREELPRGYESLAAAARDAALRAYCPYSRFAVGAAVLLDNGEIITGCNQENAAYPSGLCAERVALFAAASAYPAARVLALPRHRLPCRKRSGRTRHPLRRLPPSHGRDSATLRFRLRRPPARRHLRHPHPRLRPPALRLPPPLTLRPLPPFIPSPILPNYRTKSCQITEQNRAKLPNFFLSSVNGGSPRGWCR